MKKILIAFGGTEFPECAFEFARILNERQPILLTGLFLPQNIYFNVWNLSTAMSGQLYVSLEDEGEVQHQQDNQDRFRDLCTKHAIPFRIHSDYHDFALPELKTETRFSDLMILCTECFFDNLSESDLSEYIKGAIHESECPIVLLPEKFEFPKRNIIAYNGSASCVYALKQFAYLFPELAGNETLLVYSKDSHDIKLPYETYVEELARQHFSDLSLIKLDIDPKKFFYTWLQEEGQPLLISGAYGRSTFSQLLRQSFITQVVADRKLPIFIAHR